MTWGAKRPCALPPPLPSPEKWMAITLSAAKAAIRKRRTVVWSQAPPRAGGEPSRRPPARRVNLATSAVWSAAAAREPQTSGWDRLADGLRAVRQIVPSSAVSLSVRLRGFVEGAWSKPISPATVDGSVHQQLERALTQELHRGRRMLAIAAVLLVGLAGFSSRSRAPLSLLVALSCSQVSRRSSIHRAESSPRSMCATEAKFLLAMS